MIHVICDLDGVIYRGRALIGGSGEGLKRLNDSFAVIFVTNNSTRRPTTTAEKITDMTGVRVTPDQVLTSSMAAAGMLTADDSPVLAIGEEGVRHAVTSAGLELTGSPDEARTVMVGLTRDIGYQTIADAAAAVRGGARFIATNVDPTFPTETGLDPGAGTLVAAIATASGRDPEIAGKPHPPMQALIRSVGVTDAWVIGDRLDTDIALAMDHPTWQTIVVLTGVTTEAEARSGDVDFIVEDFSRAVDLVLTTRDQR